MNCHYPRWSLQYRVKHRLEKSNKLRIRKQNSNCKQILRIFWFKSWYFANWMKFRAMITISYRWSYFFFYKIVHWVPGCTILSSPENHFILACVFISPLYFTEFEKRIKKFLLKQYKEISYREIFQPKFPMNPVKSLTSWKRYRLRE